MGRGNRFLQPEMGSPEGVYNSSVVPGGQSPQPCKEPTSSNYSHGPSLEGAALVSSLAREVVQLSQVTLSDLQLNSMGFQPGSVGSTAPVGCVAYLREKFGHANSSSESKELLLSSWKAKHPAHMIPTSGNGWAGVLNGSHFRTQLISWLIYIHRDTRHPH